MIETEARLMLDSAPGASVSIGGRVCDYFNGTGYFALQGHPVLAQALCQSVAQFGLGAATSRDGYGLTEAIVAVENQAARLFACESAYFFGSGYFGPAVLLQGLTGQYDHIFVDAASHYAVMDAIAISGKACTAFAHADADDLAKQLARRIKPGQIPLVISDGVFAVSGRIAPLQDYHQLLARYDHSLLCVDDAHGLGVLGKQGRGSLEYCAVEGERRHACGTLSKAFGGFGGLITGTEAFVEQLRKGSHIPWGSSSVPTPIAAATAAALTLVEQQPAIRQQLEDNVAYVRQGFRSMAFDPIPDTPVPIISLSGRGLDLAALQRQLMTQNILVSYIPEGGYTGVPEGGTIRISIFSSHQREQLDRLLLAIGDWLASA